MVLLHPNHTAEQMHMLKGSAHPSQNSMHCICFESKWPLPAGNSQRILGNVRPSFKFTNNLDQEDTLKWSLMFSEQQNTEHQPSPKRENIPSVQHALENIITSWSNHSPGYIQSIYTEYCSQCYQAKKNLKHQPSSSKEIKLRTKCVIIDWL